MAEVSIGRLREVSTRTVEYFGVALVGALWWFLIGGSPWGDKFHYQWLFDVSLPVMVAVLGSGLLTWQFSRRHAFVHFAVLLAWGFWAALPRL